VRRRTRRKRKRISRLATRATEKPERVASFDIGLAFSPDSRLLAVGSADQTVRLWNVSDPAHLWDTSPAAAKANACVGAGQGITHQEWATYIPGVACRAPC
jgi:WD40 repeat protein